MDQEQEAQTFSGLETLSNLLGFYLELKKSNFPQEGQNNHTTVGFTYCPTTGTTVSNDLPVGSIEELESEISTILLNKIRTGLECISFEENIPEDAIEIPVFLTSEAFMMTKLDPNLVLVHIETRERLYCNNNGVHSKIEQDPLGFNTTNNVKESDYKEDYLWVDIKSLDDED